MLLSVGSGHVNITAVKAARDAGLRPRYVVRLVETEGWEGEAILRLPFVVARAWTANLMEDLEAEFSVEPGTREIRVPVGPWKLRTLVVEPER